MVPAVALLGEMRVSCLDWRGTRFGGGAELSSGGDEVTQTMKLKRRVINQKYGDVIESLYS